MPTYVFSTEAGRLTQSQRLDIVRSLTTIHAEETGAPRYLVVSRRWWNRVVA